MQNPPATKAPDAIKSAEQRGYSKGYASGRKRGEIDGRRTLVRSEHQEFLDHAFLAALPVAMTMEGWARDGVSIKSLKERVRLASEFAQEALRLRPIA